MDSLTLAFALEGTRALRLGVRGGTDLLAVSLSTTDAIGHAFGPDSREIHDQVLRLDRYLAWFLERSEEHTSELQSQSNLVCRLLLEKKKKIETTTPSYARDAN